MACRGRVLLCTRLFRPRAVALRRSWRSRRVCRSSRCGLPCPCSSWTGSWFWWTEGGGGREPHQGPSLFADESAGRDGEVSRSVESRAVIFRISNTELRANSIFSRAQVTALGGGRAYDVYRHRFTGGVRNLGIWSCTGTVSPGTRRKGRQIVSPQSCSRLPPRSPHSCRADSTSTRSHNSASKGVYSVDPLIYRCREVGAVSGATYRRAYQRLRQLRTWNWPARTRRRLSRRGPCSPRAGPRTRRGERYPSRNLLANCPSSCPGSARSSGTRALAPNYVWSTIRRGPTEQATHPGRGCSMQGSARAIASSDGGSPCLGGPTHPDRARGTARAGGPRVGAARSRVRRGSAVSWSGMGWAAWLSSSVRRGR